jgi:hypothetical protein
MANDPPVLEQHHCDAGTNFVRIVYSFRTVGDAFLVSSNCASFSIGPQSRLRHSLFEFAPPLSRLPTRSLIFLLLPQPGNHVALDTNTGVIVRKGSSALFVFEMVHTQDISPDSHRCEHLVWAFRRGSRQSAPRKILKK